MVRVGRISEYFLSAIDCGYWTNLMIGMDTSLRSFSIIEDRDVCEEGEAHGRKAYLRVLLPFWW